MCTSAASSTESRKSDSLADDSNSFSSPCSVNRRRRRRLKDPLEKQPIKDADCSFPSSCNSDSSACDEETFTKMRECSKRLPPLGVFWDIENCHVPKKASAASVVQRIRERFLKNYRETEFLVVCDVRKENAQILQDLHDAQVNLIHVSSTSKNAADEKLRQSLRRFAEVFEAPSAVVLISGDINFAADLYDLRYRKKIYVILVHNANTADALILCANENYVYSDLTEDLPVTLKKDKKQNPDDHPVDLLIYNLPGNCDPKKTKRRIEHLVDNCGGRILNVLPDRGIATVRFTSMNFATRAQRRIQGEDVFGNKVKVLNPSAVRDPALKSYTGRRIKNNSSHQNGGGGRDGFQGAKCGNSFRKNPIPIPPPLQERQPLRGIANNSSLKPVISHRLSAFNNSSPSQQLPQLQDIACALPSTLFVGDCENLQDSSLPEISDPVELTISNLDAEIDVGELRAILKASLGENVRILDLSVSIQTDGMSVANLRVGSEQEAMFTISQLHRQKFNLRKRLVISYTQKNMRDYMKLRTLVTLILQGTSSFSMHLYLLIHVLQDKYYTSVSVSDIFKLHDVCVIEGNGPRGRIVILKPEYRVATDSSCVREALFFNYCSIHRPESDENKGWAEVINAEILYVEAPLKEFSKRVYELLHIHSGSVLLLSFPVCYKMVYGEVLPLKEDGVPLEHLLACIRNVRLRHSGPLKTVEFTGSENGNEGSSKGSISPKFNLALPSNIKSLSRELIELLKMYDNCQISINSFIPAYHHHFGRQLRVAEYGHLKLNDLLVSMPQVLQILGEGMNRVLTLTHETQMHRFAADLTKILRAQSSKQISVKEFPAIYEKTFKKQFRPADYGLCYFRDLLEEIPENLFVFSKVRDEEIIALPKREQTDVEMIRTRKFASQVENLLHFSPNCSMLFNKFVPAYHYHFGYQCKVSDYGFTKLIELFEAIPDTIRIEKSSNGERWIRLTQEKALQVLKTQIISLVRDSELPYLPLELLPSAYLSRFGYPLNSKSYDCEDMLQLVAKLDDFIQVIPSVTAAAGQLLIYSDKQAQNFAIKVWSVLINPPHTMPLTGFITEFCRFHDCNVSLSSLEQHKDLVLVYRQGKELQITLTHYYIFASQLYKILYNAGGQVTFDDLEKLYLNTYDKTFNIPNGDLHSVGVLAARFNFMLTVEKVGVKYHVRLNRRLADYKIPLPASNYGNADDSLLFRWPLPPSLSTDAKICPAKPDTPPAPGVIPWSPPGFGAFPDLQIHLPPLTVWDFNADHSAEKNCLPSDLFSSTEKVISSPDPASVPMPKKFLGQDSSLIHMRLIDSMKSAVERSNDSMCDSGMASRNQDECIAGGDSPGTSGLTFYNGN